MNNLHSLDILVDKKGDYGMDRYGSNYINRIISDNASKNGCILSLDVSEIGEHDQESLVSMLFKHDSVTREIIQNRIQDLIDEKLPWIENDWNYSRGLIPLHDKQTGEVIWTKP